jgi:PAS domain S-box-containing protein
VHPDDLKRVGGSVFKAIADPKEHYWEDEFSILNANGEYVYVYDKGYILRDENGKALRMIGATKNIDVRKRTEIALQESEIRYKTLIELSPEPIIVNCHDKIVYVNPAAVKMFGTSSAEEILNMSSIEFIVPEYVDLTLKGVINILRGNTDPELTEVQLYKLDGTIIDVEAQGIAIEFNKEPAIQISMRDITKRKRNEIEKYNADEKIRTLSTAIEQIHVSVIVTDLEGTIVYVNPRFTEMTGYSFDEAVGENPKILKTGFTSATEYETMWKNLIRGKNWKGIFQNKKKNGELFWESAIITPIKNDLGEITNFIALKEDITAKLQLEFDIKENNKKLEDYKYALDESAIIAITDKEGEILSVNDNFCSLSKFSREELVGKTHQIINSNYHPISFFKDLWDTILSGKVWKGEIRNKNKDNDYYWEYTTIIPFLDNDGLPFQFLAIRFDITNRKIAEDTILNILEEKNTILESIGDAFFAVNNDWVITYWNKQSEVLLEKTKDEVLGRNLWEVFSNTISTEALKNYHKALENKQVIHFEDYYAPLKKWYEVSVYPSEKGLAVYFKDISERIQYTTAIEAQNKKLHEIAWTQSHIARAPLSRMMGIVDLLKDTEMSTEEFKEWVKHFVYSGNELDTIIKEITKKSE